ncbi:unnamed protein product [Arctogadus glacialis]
MCLRRGIRGQSIDCPRGSRNTPGGVQTADPFSNDALVFTRDLVLQREVEVEVESMDKAGNFIGWLHIEGVNLSVALVESALSKVHFTAERSSYYKTLVTAEEPCRERKEKLTLRTFASPPKAHKVRP